MNKLNYLFLLLALVAEIIGTVGGFGSSVFFVPIGNFFFDFHFVLGLTALFHLFSNVSKIMLFKKGLDKKLLMNIGIPSVIFVIIGGFLTKVVDSSFLEITLALFLVSLSLLFLIKKDLVINPNKKNAITGGVLSGFSAGLLGTGGAIRGLTMAAFNLEKSVFIATSAFIDFFIDFTRTFVYFNNGYIQKEHLIYLPFLLIIGVSGTYLGKRILQYIKQDKFKRISLLLILLIGLVTLANILIKLY
ncbi:sulfite exporter TauE/SafE family protein [Maribacter sp. PR1]|uniref:Probable membrane transporter protein n=1 Tax=Maribacter cobaltidurans TaxID=1178778 RepID=A0ABU7IQT6_9FLAO|nr:MULTISPECIES: sulfite exporter TauE/SafE family protein [Maribacter]MDC6387835.1 sulfite exporter TauE/SafE family protein [Maribacter sp. PR1]MEE1975224.1 sulfite exporter TauE/SafE family protein [Maribacter cobaltidurans]